MNTPDGYDVRRRLLCIDMLRGVACLSVLLFHICGDGFNPPGPNNPLFTLIGRASSLGYLGVNLFLVLSGFCIHMTSLRQDGRFNVRSFWLRRLFRLYPPYLVALTVSLAVGCVGSISRTGGLHLNWPPSGYHSSSEFGLDFISHVFMLHILSLSNVYGMFNPPLWSLALEEQLYAIYTGFRLVGQRFYNRSRLLSAVCITVVWRVVGVAMGWDLGFPWLLQAPARWFEWYLGAISVESHYTRQPFARWCYSPAWAVLAFAVGSMLDKQSIAGKVLAEPAYGISFFLILNWLCERERTGRLRHAGPVGWLAFCGTWSYSLYLIHAPVIRLLRAIFKILGRDPSSDLACCLFLVMSLLAGYLFYQLVERRFLNKSVQSVKV